jgi:hypothetical protein
MARVVEHLRRQRNDGVVQPIILDDPLEDALSPDPVQPVKRPHMHFQRLLAALAFVLPRMAQDSLDQFAQDVTRQRRLALG